MSAVGTAPTASVVNRNDDLTDDLMIVQLAREIAMDIHPTEQILRNHQISPTRWEEIQRNTRFRQILQGFVEEWNSADNTEKRTKLKALSFVEESMPEMYARLHSPAEPLPAKAKVLEVVAKIAGLGANGAMGTGGSGEKFSVTINLGEQKTLVVSAPTPQAIDTSDK